MVVHYNVYCDESGHLEHDEVGVMVLGAVWCPADKVKEASSRIREIKGEQGQSSRFEVKWKKVSLGGLGLYRALVDYFFDDDDLHFRALVVRDKSQLRHDEFEQTHDDWYYKMYFSLLMPLLRSDAGFRIYVDIKDSFSGTKTKKLEEVLTNASYDYSRSIIERIQPVRSHEIELVQLTDLLIGAVSYANRGLSGNAAKVRLVERMQERSRLSLKQTTLLREEKVNLFSWSPSS